MPDCLLPALPSIPFTCLAFPFSFIVVFIFSCMALSDLLSGRSVEDVLDSLPKLWELCFRARDDIKVGNK